MVQVDPLRITEAVRRARQLIEARGYQPIWGEGGSLDPLNISEALASASNGNNNLYLRCRQSFSKNWGGPVEGLLNWETTRRRSKDEVLRLFDLVLERLESSETTESGSGGGGAGGPGLRAT